MTRYFDPQTDTLDGLGDLGQRPSRMMNGGSGARRADPSKAIAYVDASGKRYTVDEWQALPATHPAKREKAAKDSRRRATSKAASQTRRVNDKKLGELISAGRFREAWQTGLIGTSYAETSKGRIATPQENFNWAAYRFVVTDPKKLPPNKSPVDLAPPWRYGIKAKPFTRSELPRIRRLYRHEDGGPPQDPKGRDKTAAYLRQQAKQLEPGSMLRQRAVRLQLPALMYRNTKQRRTIKDSLIKVSKFAVIAVGGAMLGNAIIGKLGAAAAKSAGSKAAALTAGTPAAATPAGAAVAAAGGAGGAVASTGGLAATAATAAKAGAGVLATVGGALKTAAPVAEKVINTARVVDAVRKGELPPPPVSFGDGNLTDYAKLVGNELLQRELQRRVSADEQALLDAMIEAEQRAWAQYEPKHPPVVNTGLHPELTYAQREHADETIVADGTANMIKLAAIALPVAFIVMRQSA